MTVRGFDDDLKITNEYMLDTELVEKCAQHIISDVNRILLSDKTREVSDHVADYIANKLQKFCEVFYSKQLVGEKRLGVVKNTWRHLS